jgi:diguanylate cyclase (GGDEF)-like protein/PAS domain S-box-containing protein
MLRHIFKISPNVSAAWQRFPILLQLATLLIITLPLVWGYVWYEVHKLESISEQESRKELGNIAMAYADEIRSTAQTIDLLLMGLRDRWTGDRERYKETVQQLKVHLRSDLVTELQIINPAGAVLFSTQEPHETIVDERALEHLHIHRKGSDRFIVMPSVPDSRRVQFSRPILGKNGEYEGVIIISVSPRHLSNVYDRLDLGGKGAIGLLHYGGTILTRAPYIEGAIGKQFATEWLGFVDFPAIGFHRYTSEVDGVERIYAWRSLADYPLIVLASMSVEDLRTRYQSLWNNHVYGGVALSLLLVAALFALLTKARDRAQAIERLAKHEARWRLALEAAGHGVWDWNVMTGKLTLSFCLREILGLAGQQLPNTMPELFRHIHPEDAEGMDRALRAHLCGESPSLYKEFRFTKSDGTLIWILARGSVSEHGTSGKPLRLVGTFVDVTDRKLREQAIKFAAEHDALTGLPNRVLFQDRLAQAIALAKREESSLAILYCDLDRFKPVNDTYGHHVGDELLKQIVQRVRACLRNSDTVARIGGDEFLVLLPKITHEMDALTVAEAIRETLSEPFFVGGNTLQIGTSIGVATYPGDGETEEALIQTADAAMYRVKETNPIKKRAMNVLAKFGFK